MQHGQCVPARAAKYVRYYGGDDAEELYDLGADPREVRNRGDA